MIKKAMALTLTSLLLVLMLFGCGRSAEDAEDAPSTGGHAATEASAATEKLKIVATTFPQYDWVREILGEDPTHVELILLLEDGVDLHSYQPTASEMIMLSTCDLLIYTGGESDEWIADALKNAQNLDMVVINLLDVLGDAAKKEALVEGMEPEPGEHSAENDEHNPDNAFDEHIWLSLRNAQLLCRYIADQLRDIDKPNAEEYASNADAYIAQLAQLDAQYTKMVADAACHTLLFGDRFPFRYLADDYGLNYYAAFAGCSAETEASFETVIFLAEKIDELSLDHILVIETSDQALAKTIIKSAKNTGCNVLVLNSIQSVSAADLSDGISYLSLMQYNLTVLTEALG